MVDCFLNILANFLYLVHTSTLHTQTYKIILKFYLTRFVFLRGIIFHIFSFFSISILPLKKCNLNFFCKFKFFFTKVSRKTVKKRNMKKIILKKYMGVISLGFGFIWFDLVWFIMVWSCFLFGLVGLGMYMVGMSNPVLLRPGRLHNSCIK